MKVKSKIKKPIIVCAVVCILLLPGCLSKRYITFKGVGFHDVNRNGVRDAGEEKILNFRVTVKLHGLRDGLNVGPFESVEAIAYNGNYELRSTEDDEYSVDIFIHKVSVTKVPEGYIVGEFINSYNFPEETDPEYGCRRREFTQKLDIPFVIDEEYSPPITQTPTPTPTSTATPTNTPIPTSTFTPTPTIEVDLLGYGSGYGLSGYAVDFVKFMIYFRPAGGTYSAVVNGKDYTCVFPYPAQDILMCEGEPFPNGKYVDVILYWNGIQIYSGQIFRAEEEPEKKPTPTDIEEG